MRWPWVSRLTFDLVFQHLERTNEALASEREHSRALARTLHEMAEVAQPFMVPVPPFPPPKEPSIIASAIHEMAEGDPRLAAYLHRRKRELRAEFPKMKDEGIAQMLMQWETSEGRSVNESSVEE